MVCARKTVSEDPPAKPSASSICSRERHTKPLISEGTSASDIAGEISAAGDMLHIFWVQPRDFEDLCG